MTYPVISDVYRCAMEWVNADTGLSASNVMHFHDSSTDPATLAADFDSHVTAAMFHVQTTHSHVSFLNVTPLDGSSVTYPFPTGSPAKWSGVQTDEDFIPQACNIVKLLTAKRGRSYRGRLYLPWIGVSAADGKLAAGDSADVTAAWVAFKAAMEGDGHTLGVASYTLGTIEPVIALACEEFTATQRRRQQRTSLTI